MFCSLIVPTLFFNTYKGWAVLYICGCAEFLYSRYRVMHYKKCFLHYRYSPIIRLLKEPSKWIQVWYADDVSACGELSHIRGWFDLLSIMDLCMFIIQIHLNVVLLLTILVMIVLYRFLALLGV